MLLFISVKEGGERIKSITFVKTTVDQSEYKNLKYV